MIEIYFVFWTSLQLSVQCRVLLVVEIFAVHMFLSSFNSDRLRNWIHYNLRRPHLALVTQIWLKQSFVFSHIPKSFWKSQRRVWRFLTIFYFSTFVNFHFYHFFRKILLLQPALEPLLPIVCHEAPYSNHLIWYFRINFTLPPIEQKHVVPVLANNGPKY